eukprot:COSAG02_NODE_134_length_34593_cov_43.594886_23_plen_255_part_00
MLFIYSLTVHAKVTVDSGPLQLKTLKDILNAALRGQHAEQALTHTNVAWTQSLPVVEQLFINNVNGGDGTPPEIFMQMSSGADVVAWRFASSYGTGAQTINVPLQAVAGASLLPDSDDIAIPGNPISGTSSTTWVENENAARQVVAGLNPATVDRVHSLQIATPGLATGVHVNGQGGSSTLCRFPVNTDPGGVIQFEPINPIKNTYDMSGTRITRFRVELQDQHGEPVDTREEEYNCTIVIEYEIPSLATTGDN